jgi:hypothetical protein
VLLARFCPYISLVPVLAIPYLVAAKLTPLERFSIPSPLARRQTPSKEKWFCHVSEEVLGESALAPSHACLARGQRLGIVHPHAAGIDVGNEVHYVAVCPEQDTKGEPVRSFACYTADLERMADSLSVWHSHRCHAVNGGLLRWADNKSN